ncbi:MAG: rhodanese-like domain-containing protein [Gammaproteobacteria bacterium]|nr:rhodanese-like domain-containing protein [Gammaproteobacteria bacterium]
MKTFKNLLDDCRKNITELFPWDLEELLNNNTSLLVLDVREPAEFKAMHIANSINVPRGILETACEWGFDETVPALVEARDKTVIVVCRSGNRSLLAAKTMQLMGYQDARSLQTGLRGWNDYEQPLIDSDGKAVDEDFADDFFTSRVSDEQLGPKS